MDKEFFENKEGCSNEFISRDEVIKDLESKSEEEVNAETKEMLEEVKSVMSFARDRLTEITDKHKSLCAVGGFGAIASVSFCGKPVTFMGLGTKKAINDAFKVVMAGMVSREN